MLTGAETHARLESLIGLLLIILITVSGVYAIPYSSIPAEKIIFAKRVLYVIVMVLILLWVVVTHHVKAGKRFSIFCAIYGALLTVNMLIRNEKYPDYIYMLASIAFVWSLVKYFSDSRALQKYGSNYLRNSLAVVAVFCLVVVVFCFFKNEEALSLAVNGFNGNRVNFSIWISQFVFLSFFLLRKDDLLYPMVIVSILIAAQILSGGRIGLIASLCIATYFIVKRGRNAGMKLGLMVYLSALVWIFGSYSPTAAMTLTNVGIGQAEVSKLQDYKQVSIFRSLSVFSMPTSESQSLAANTHSYIDRLTSHRLSILGKGVESLDARAALYGKGLGNFKVNLPERSWSVHNVFLKIFGELGIPVLLMLILMLAIPIFRAHRSSWQDKAARFMIFVGIGIAMMQPQYLVTGLSECLVFWVCYAWLTSADPDRNDRFKLDQGYNNVPEVVDRRIRLA